MTFQKMIMLKTMDYYLHLLALMNFLLRKILFLNLPLLLLIKIRKISLILIILDFLKILTNIFPDIQKVKGTKLNLLQWTYINHITN